MTEQEMTVFVWEGRPGYFGPAYRTLERLREEHPIGAHHEVRVWNATHVLLQSSCAIRLLTHESLRNGVHSLNMLFPNEEAKSDYGHITVGAELDYKVSWSSVQLLP